MALARIWGVNHGRMQDGQASSVAELEQWPAAAGALMPTTTLPALPAVAPHAEFAERPVYAPTQRLQIDWEALLFQRTSVLQHAADLPPYLLLPEIHRILHLIKYTHSRLLFASLWVTGASISEALALTPSSFCFDQRNPYALLASLKKGGRPKKRECERKPRLVPIRTVGYLDQIEVFIHDKKLGREERLFPVSRQAIDAQLRRVMGDYEAQFGALPIPVSCRTFRHSFAVNCVLHQVPLPVVQAWLGHEHIKSTIIYTQVLSLETGNLMARVEF